MTIYEKAAESVGLVYIEAHETQICAAAVWDAIYACPQCDGRGSDWKAGGISMRAQCPAEHVVMANPHSGEERYCKPEMAEWRCYKHNFISSSPSKAIHWWCPPSRPGHEDLYSAEHADCGWKPVPYENLDSGGANPSFNEGNNE